MSFKKSGRTSLKKEFLQDHYEDKNISSEDQLCILKERALALGKELKGAETETEYIGIAEFILASERYGIETLYIDEVHPFKDYTPIPCTPNYIFGIMNVRGKIVTVIDLKKFFDLPESNITAFNKVIIIHNETMEFGILADSILGVRQVSTKTLQPSLPTLTGIHSDYLMGVTADRLIVLDSGKLLSNKKLIVHEEA